MASLPVLTEDMSELTLCPQCRDYGGDIAVFQFCPTCWKVLCETCTEYHKVFKITKEHKLIDAKEMFAGNGRAYMEMNTAYPARSLRDASDTGPLRDATDSGSRCVRTPPRDRKLVYAMEYIIHPDKRHPPCFTGVAMHTDGRLILTDYPWYTCNGDVCLYSPAQNRLIRTSEIRNPYCTAPIDEHRLAVSQPDNNTICIVTIGTEKLKLVKVHRMKYKAKGLIALNDGSVAVAWDCPSALGVLEFPTNNQLKPIQRWYLDRDIKGRKFRCMNYLAIDELRQHVIQPCSEENAVYCFSYIGIPVFKYTHPDFKEPEDVALDKDGYIFVLEHGSIHKLSAAGEGICIIKEGVPAHPSGICCDPAGRGFWVTQVAPTSDSVRYFRLQS